MESGKAEDVLIVGAGPAGLAVAIGAAMRGLRVRVVDVSAPPADKACGEGLLPDAVAALTGLGVRPGGGHPILGIRFEDGRRTAEARFAGDGGRGVRRTELHRAMLERADALGLEVEWRTAIRELQGQPARFVVGADGGQSAVRAVAGLGGARNLSVTSRRVGLRQHFALRPWSACVLVYWTDGAQAYVTPVGTGEVGVAFVSGRKFASVAEALGSFPALRERLAGAATTSTPRGAATVTRRLRRVTARDRVALVGDASGSVDAVTGEGLNLCFRQAEALAAAMAAGGLEPYEAAHRATMRVPRVMSRALLTLDRCPGLRVAAMVGLGRWPGLFGALLRVHAGGPQGTSGWVEAEVVPGGG